MVYQTGIGHGYQMGLHPQTMYGIADSPVGLAAYFLDHDVRSLGDDRARVRWRVVGPDARRRARQHHDRLADEHRRVERPSVWEYWGKGFFNDYNISVPAAVSVFPEEVYQAPRSWTERAYKNLIHFNELPKGGHFAAWEQPQLFSEEVRAGFRSLR